MKWCGVGWGDGGKKTKTIQQTTTHLVPKRIVDLSPAIFPSSFGGNSLDRYCTHMGYRD